MIRTRRAASPCAGSLRKGAQTVRRTFEHVRVSKQSPAARTRRRGAGAGIPSP